MPNMRRDALIEMLSSLSGEWEFAGMLLTKLENGEVSPEQAEELYEIFMDSAKGVEAENAHIRARDASFRKQLFAWEEESARQEEWKNLQHLLKN